MNSSVEYQAWAQMLFRCTNPKHRLFDRYGGRGITVCDRWRSFESFLEDMGRRPSAKHSLDRIDNDGNYEPQNCRWATWKEQNRNTSRNRCITIDGETKPLSVWLEAFGISRRAFYHRLRRGMTAQEALTTPSRRSA